MRLFWIGFFVVGCTGETNTETGEPEPYTVSWEAGDASCQDASDSPNSPSRRNLEGWISEDGLYLIRWAPSSVVPMFPALQQERRAW